MAAPVSVHSASVAAPSEASEIAEEMSENEADSETSSSTSEDCEQHPFMMYDSEAEIQPDFPAAVHEGRLKEFQTRLTAVFLANNAETLAILHVEEAVNSMATAATGSVFPRTEIDTFLRVMEKQNMLQYDEDQGLVILI